MKAVTAFLKAHLAAIVIACLVFIIVWTWGSAANPTNPACQQGIRLKSGEVVSHGCTNIVFGQPPAACERLGGPACTATPKPPPATATMNAQQKATAIVADALEAKQIATANAVAMVIRYGTPLPSATPFPTRTFTPVPTNTPKPPPTAKPPPPTPIQRPTDLSPEGQATAQHIQEQTYLDSLSAAGRDIPSPKPEWAKEFGSTLSGLPEMGTLICVALLGLLVVGGLLFYIGTHFETVTADVIFIFTIALPAVVVAIFEAGAYLISQYLNIQLPGEFWVLAFAIPAGFVYGYKLIRKAIQTP